MVGRIIGELNVVSQIQTLIALISTTAAHQCMCLLLNLSCFLLILSFEISGLL